MPDIASARSSILLFGSARFLLDTEPNQRTIIGSEFRFTPALKASSTELLMIYPLA